MPSPPPLHVPASAGFERLPLWKNAWRLAMAWVLGLILFVIYIAPLVMASETDSSLETDAVIGLILLDLLVGHLILVLAAFRRRAPVAIGVVTMVLSTVSAFGAPAAFLVVLSLATRRRLLPLVWLGLLNVVAGLVHEHTVAQVTVPAQFRQSLTGQGALLDGLVYAAFVTLFYVVVALIGWNIGSRRELLASWRQQAETANREQAARVAQAQLAERARIAREMHDVLAHRLSLVAMHAGVLAHRPDLSEEERAEATEVVRAGTHQALEELREVLGVLRTDGDADGGGIVGAVEAPQPGLSGIPSLVAEVTSSGQEVRLVAGPDLWRRSVSMPTTVGRHAYRVVQESLTNARKHAAGEVVTVDIQGAPEEGLTIEVRNRVVPDRAGTLPESGRGLTGMAERVQLAGGTFEAGVEISDFVVRVGLPWPAADGQA